MRALPCQNESLLRLDLHWLQQANLWRERTNLRTGSERLTGVIRRLDPEALAFFGPGHRSSVRPYANMGVVVERWCPTQQMLGVFLTEGK